MRLCVFKFLDRHIRVSTYIHLGHRGGNLLFSSSLCLNCSVAYTVCKPSSREKEKKTLQISFAAHFRLRLFMRGKTPVSLLETVHTLLGLALPTHFLIECKTRTQLRIIHPLCLICRETKFLSLQSQATAA